ncbi:terminase small subunit [Pseudomonas sp. NPDC098747]|uniref:terminase small subunit n=1 Tax=Pseudomonas sp. NPDC098747 TaxID=3364487 RepID=UPI00383B192E
MSGAKKDVDWYRIEQEYREGVVTLRDIAAQHDVTHGAINKRAKRDGWERGTGKKASSKKALKVSKAVSKQVSKVGIHESLDTSLDTCVVEPVGYADDVDEIGESSSLTPKQKRFVEEYLIDLNATQAAIRAKYSIKSASSIGRDLLQKTPVADAIAVAIANRSARASMAQDRVLSELAAMAYYDPADIGSVRVEKPADIAKLPEHVRRAIVGWSWDKHGNFVLKLASKTPNVELLGRHQGMFKDRLEVTPAGPLTPPEYRIVSE